MLLEYFLIIFLRGNFSLLHLKSECHNIDNRNKLGQALRSKSNEIQVSIPNLDNLAPRFKREALTNLGMSEVDAV